MQNVQAVRREEDGRFGEVEAAVVSDVLELMWRVQKPTGAEEIA
jgi:hypothetical protein